jgi:hypothetical protein
LKQFAEGLDADWRISRASEFMLAVSKDETAGNQSCQLRLAAGGQLSLKLRPT